MLLQQLNLCCHKPIKTLRFLSATKVLLDKLVNLLSLSTKYRQSREAICKVTYTKNIEAILLYNLKPRDEYLTWKKYL